MCKIPNLPLEEIDPKCREFVYLLNKYGFKTQFCCQGHDYDEYNTKYMIIFDKIVSDTQMDELVSIFGNMMNCNINKWKRMVYKYGEPVILTNWMISFDYSNDCKWNHSLGKEACELFKNRYENQNKEIYWLYDEERIKVFSH